MSVTLYLCNGGFAVPESPVTPEADVSLPDLGAQVFDEAFEVYDVVGVR